MQPGVLEPVPLFGRMLTFRLSGALEEGVQILRALGVDGVVVGLGPRLVAACPQPLSGLHEFETGGSGPRLPSTPSDLLVWVRGASQAEVQALAEGVRAALAAAFTIESEEALFKYRDGRDLTGYVDGTENPEERALEVCQIPRDDGPGAGAFLSVQKWVHDLDLFESFSQERKDHTIGRRLSDNEELDDAPSTAHVKRTAQESFEPEAFLLRRSMPFDSGKERGLMFIAFAASLEPFEAQMRRMRGQEDGVVDALFDFSHPVTGAHFWYPAESAAKLDLSPVGY